MNKQIKRKLILIIIVLLLVATIFTIIKFSDKNQKNKLLELYVKNNIKKPNIILITLDTLRADHLPIYGYANTETPVLDKLAKKGLVFDTCITSDTLTLPAHSSIMTGMYPTNHGIHINGDNVLSEKQITIAEKIKELEYNTAAFIAAFVLDGRWGLKQGFDYYDDNFDLEKFKTNDLGRVQRPANEVIDSSIKWLENNKNKPFFSWIHLYDPHTPYKPPEEYLNKYNNRGRIGLYDGEIAFMDSQIGRLIDWLNSNELMKNTILIIVGDHGESLGEHKEDTHGFFIYDSTIRVPLIIVTPFESLNNRRVKTQVRTIDIFPTILEFLKIPEVLNIHGKSLIPLFFNESNDRVAYSESIAPRLQYNWSALYSLRTTKYKYIEAPRPEFYNLVEDPEELKNILRRETNISKRYRNQLYGIIKESENNSQKADSANLDKETLSKLATLGYIGTSNNKTTSLAENRKLPDPKDRVTLFNMISMASEYISEKNYDKALGILEEVVERDPKNPQIRLLLASSYMHEKKYAEAKSQLDTILKKNPESIKALITLANLFYKKNDHDDVQTICKKILSIDKKYNQALGLMGRSLMFQGKLDKALDYFQKAIEIQPKLMLNRVALAKCLIKGNQYEDAKKHLDMVITLHPDYFEAHYNYALIYENEGNYEEAKEEYLKEIKNHPNFVPARFNYAKLILSYNLEEYVKHMKEIIKINSESAKGHLFLARGLLKIGDPDNIIIINVNKGLKLTDDPKLKALGYYILADIYNRTGDRVKLGEVLKKAKSFRSKIEKES